MVGQVNISAVCAVGVTFKQYGSGQICYNLHTSQLFGPSLFYFLLGTKMSLLIEAIALQKFTKMINPEHRTVPQCKLKTQPLKKEKEKNGSETETIIFLDSGRLYLKDSQRRRNRQAECST